MLELTPISDEGPDNIVIKGSLQLESYKVHFLTISCDDNYETTLLRLNREEVKQIRDYLNNWLGE